MCFWHNLLDPRFRRWVTCLKFQLFPEGGSICAFFNLGKSDRPRVARGSEYRRAWVIAHGEQPRKRQGMGARVFLNKIFKVRIADVPQRHDGREHPKPEVYSTVKELIVRVWP